MNHLAAFRDFLDSLVHPSARRDAVTAARHRAFIAPRLAASLTVFAALPVLLALPGLLDVSGLLLFGSLALPIACVYFLSSTGQYEDACLMSATSMAAVVTAVAAFTGGFASFAVPWMAIVPIEAALSGSRRVVAIACGVLAAGLAALIGAQALNMLPAHGYNALVSGLGLSSALFYAAGIAVAAQWFDRAHAQRLQDEESRYRLLARNMTDVITCHGRTGAVSFASPAADEVFGVPAQALKGHGLFDRVHVADRPAYLTALADAAALSLDRSVEFRVRVGAPEGDAGPARHRWIEMRCRPLETGGEGGREVVAVMRDVTAHKRHEEALRAARAEAERANADKSRFLAVVSHELRTPLNAVIGFSELLMNEDAMQLDRARRVEYATLVHQSGQHLLSVVNGILDMSKIEAGHFEITTEPFDPVPVVRGCCDLLSLKAHDAGIEIVIEAAETGCEIVADRRALRQIVLNLLANAIKFSPRGGHVTVRAHPCAGAFEVSVEDEGIGIASEHLPRLGRPFFQVASSYDRPYSGTGLGLSIVKGLVDLHGGAFEVDSRLDNGTCVKIRLPTLHERREPSALQASGNIASLARAPSAKRKPLDDAALASEDLLTFDHDDMGSNRPNVMNVIDSNHLERDCREKPVPAFSHPALERKAQ